MTEQELLEEIWRLKDLIIDLTNERAELYRQLEKLEKELNKEK